MVHVLRSDMSDEEILLATVRDYACESNYEGYEKDYGVGRPVMRAPWIRRDNGDHARRALEIIEGRKNDTSDS